GQAPAVPDRRRRMHEWIGEAELAGEVPGVAGDVVRVDPEDDEPLAPVRLPASLELRRLPLARGAPGGPEVHDHRLAAERGEGDAPLAVEPRQVEGRRRPRLAVRDPNRDRVPVLVDDPPDQEREEP